MEEPLHIPYHTPDNIWTAFSGVTDFESYAEKFVVKGRFHKDVPPEVVEGYAIAEHIMAHAYYHYPAMDEALVKLLRVLEMAVKMRCKQVLAPTDHTNNKTMLERFEQEKSELDAHQKTVFQINSNSVIAGMVTKSRYEYWGS